MKTGWKNPIEAQRRELERVRKNIGDFVHWFCKKRVGCYFTMMELEEEIRFFKSITPGSAGRILRKLAQEEKLKYRLVSRRQGLYFVEAVQ